MAGFVAAGAAWAFWHYLGESAFAVLTTITVIALAIEKRCLRRRLGGKSPSAPEQG